MRRTNRAGTNRTGTNRTGAAITLMLVLGMLLSPGMALGHAARTTQPEPPQPLARIELTAMSPRLVTATSAAVLTVRGLVVNVGDRSITKLGVRLQRDEPVTSDPAAAAAVRDVPQAPHVTRFQAVPGDLAPGQSSPFQLEVPLRGGGELESLQIDQPGVYPLLVNVNGKPEFGGTARLASVPLLLPVLGVPPVAPGAPPGPVLPPPPQPTPLTVIWPLAAEPARLPTGPGEPILIPGDSSGQDPMAIQIAPGGRLEGLVSALEQVVPPGSPLAAAVCVAIDPLLLETVDGMSRGYQVSYLGKISEGTGAQEAQLWLERLRSVVQGRCVLPLPYADPDLVALSRAGLTDLEAMASSTGIRLIRTLLGVQPLTEVSWPAEGILDERTLADLVALQTRAVLLAPQGVSPPPSSGDVVVLTTGAADSGDAPVGLLIDPILTSALSSNAAAPNSPARQPDDNEVRVAARPTNTANPLAAQDGLGALVYRATADPDREPVLLAPPRRWQANGKEATELLRTAAELIDGGFLASRELAGLTGAGQQSGLVRQSGAAGQDGQAAAGPPESPESAALDYPLSAAASAIPPEVTSEVTQARDMLRDLQVATMRDATTNLEPADLLDPLRLGLLRATSSAWWEQPDQAAQVVGEIRNRLDELRGAVRILPSARPYTLASSDSPLLITVGNGLPVAVRVQLRLSETAGLRTGAVGLQVIPAHSTRQLVIPAKVSRAGQFSINARLSTPSGTPLGQPSTLHLRSTAFGTITIVLTAGAGAVLVILVARRIVRRVRRTPQRLSTRQKPRNRQKTG